MGVKVMAGHEISFIAVGDGGRLQREQTQRTREEIAVFAGNTGCSVRRQTKMFPQCRIVLLARCLHRLAGGGVASTLPVTDLPNS